MERKLVLFGIIGWVFSFIMNDGIVFVLFGILILLGQIGDDDDIRGFFNHYEKEAVK